MSRPFLRRRTASRGREHLVDLEQSEQIYLVIRDRENNLSIHTSGRRREHVAHDSNPNIELTTTIPLPPPLCSPHNYESEHIHHLLYIAIASALDK